MDDDRRAIEEGSGKWFMLFVMAIYCVCTLFVGLLFVGVVNLASGNLTNKESSDTSLTASHFATAAVLFFAFFPPIVTITKMIKDHKKSKRLKTMNNRDPDYK